MLNTHHSHPQVFGHQFEKYGPGDPRPACQNCALPPSSLFALATVVCSQCYYHMEVPQGLSCAVPLPGPFLWAFTFIA